MLDDNGVRSGTVTAKSGVINSRTKAMVARGSVVLAMKDGKRILTEELHYDPNSKRIWSNVPTVTINADGSRSSAKTFETDDKFRNVRATGAKGSAGVVF
jgi:LPS export ABC transporter protein LptC